MSSIVVSKLGFHSNGSGKEGLTPCLQTIYGAGRQLALADSHDDYSLGYTVAQFWPQAINIGDLTIFEANFDIKALRQVAAFNPQINYWQIYNEINGDWAGQADRQIQYMQAYGDEFKFVIFNCANGTPPYPEEDGGVAYSNIARACKVAKGRHMLGLHEYGNNWDGNTLLRYRRLVTYLRAHDALCDIVITEAGPDEGTFIGIEPFMEWCKKYDAELMKDNAIKGCALWTLGGGGWGAVNFETALPALGEYIATVPSPEIIPEPTMTKLTGVHSRESGGDLDDTDMARLVAAGGKLNSFKFTTQDARNNHARVATAGIPLQNCLVRLFWDSSGASAIPSPADFYSWFSLPIKEAIQDGIVWFEFLNEPNITQEWKWSAAEFVTFAKSVIALIKAGNPTAKIISPGLSPNPLSVPLWDQAFADGGLYAVCDGIGAHSYGTQMSHLNDDNELRYYRRFAARLMGTQKIWITEASLKFYSITPYDVGKLYGEYANTLEDYVQGVWFFILQGDAFESSGESWRGHADIPRGLADYVPPTTDREFDHWENAITGESLGTANPLTFTVTGDITVKAITRPKSVPAPTGIVSTLTDGYGVIVGGGTYIIGQPATVEWKLT